MSCDDGFIASIQSVQLKNGLQKQWIDDGVDLRRFLGKQVAVPFRLDSVDAVDNLGAGWFVDDVSVQSRTKVACKVAADCGDADGCATWACENATCVVNAPKADGSACSDGDPCTTLDACKAGSCKGAAKACDDGNPCTWDGCNASTGFCFAGNASEGTVCGLGKVCGVAGGCITK